MFARSTTPPPATTTTMKSHQFLGKEVHSLLLLREKRKKSATKGRWVSSSSVSSLSSGLVGGVQLTCPICKRPVFTTTTTTTTSTNGKKKDVCCGKTWTIETKNGYECADLEISRNANSYREAKLSGTSLFETPLVSNVYERGWRESFVWAGFPGKEKEFETAMKFVRENNNNNNNNSSGGEMDVVLDVSCGSGLFARKFAESKAFAKVVASDFSENMLKEASQFARDENIDASALSFVRADVGRLPFETSSVDVVHAGAALHCWPSPTQAVAEISRVLKPGGTFVASTFLDPSANLNNDDLTKPFSDFFRDSQLGTGGAFNRFWTEQELRDLCEMVGLEGFKRERERQYILFAVKKNSVRCEDDDETEECDIVLSVDEE